MAKIGQFIDGRFQILQLISKGGMSKVYLAKDKRLSKEWVVKEVLRPEKEESLLFINSALKEAEIIKNLNHPAIVRIVDIIQDDSAFYLIEDYVEGIPMQKYAQKYGILTEAKMKDWMEELCDVLKYLHNRTPPIIYRDLKPENIMITESSHIRLIDFGIARKYKAGKKSDTSCLGTEKYAAPEQFEEYGSQTDVRTDIYCLGSTMRCMTDYCENLSPAFLEIIRKCQEQHPKDRYQKVEDIQCDLQKIKGIAVGSKKSHSVHLSLILLAICAVVCLFLAFSVSVIRHGNQRSRLSGILQQIEEIKADGIFTKEEEEQLLNQILPDLSALKEEEGFEKAAFSIGKLYWYYYEYGSDSQNGMIEAIPWFQLSHDYSNLAKVYESIGQFHRDINMKITESEDQGLYSSYFEQLRKLINEVEDDENAEIIKLELYKLSVDSMETYARKFRADGVSLSDISEFYAGVVQNLTDMKTTSAQADAIKETLMEKAAAAQNAIDLAYEKEESK